MVLDQFALLALLGELKLTNVTDRIRMVTETHRWIGMGWPMSWNARRRMVVGVARAGMVGELSSVL